MADMQDDTELLKAARNFDQDALRTIFDSYSPIVYRYALRLCRNTLEADNIVGDVFASLLEKLAEGKGPNTNLRSYLFQITYHIIVDHARDEKRVSSLSAAENQAERVPSVVSQVEDDFRLDSIIKAMNTTLNPDQQHVLVLRFVEGFSIRETAEIVGKSVNNVKVIQNRGLEKLRQVLNQGAGF
jgi:RNA polymerase sigma-70 factor (ECF subfamily)